MMRRKPGRIPYLYCGHPWTSKASTSGSGRGPNRLIALRETDLRAVLMRQRGDDPDRMVADALARSVDLLIEEIRALRFELTGPRPKGYVPEWLVRMTSRGRGDAVIARDETQQRRAVAEPEPAHRHRSRRRRSRSRAGRLPQSPKSARADPCQRLPDCGGGRRALPSDFDPIGRAAR
jgi:hypothetical protein